MAGNPKCMVCPAVKECPEICHYGSRHCNEISSGWDITKDIDWYRYLKGTISGTPDRAEDNKFYRGQIEMASVSRLISEEQARKLMKILTTNKK